VSDVAAYLVFAYALFQCREWTGYNDMCTILIRDFNKERRELPDDDKQCAIETCRILLSVLVYKRIFRLIYNTNLVHLFVVTIQ
jgi:hypothetical protein